MPWRHIAGFCSTCVPSVPQVLFPQKSFSDYQPQAFTGSQGYSSPGISLKICISLLTNLKPVQLSSLSLWMASHPLSATPSSFGLSAKLLRVHAVTLSELLMKKLNSADLSINPWCTLLVTGLQINFILLITTQDLQHHTTVTVWLFICI